MQKNNFKNIIDSVFQQFSTCPLLFDTFSNKALNYSDGLHLIQLVSQKMIASGFVKGDKIISFVPLNLDSVLLFWACLYNGYVFIPIDCDWPEVLVGYIIEETSPKLILTDEKRLSSITPYFRSENIILTRNNTNKPEIQSFADWLETTQKANLSAFIPAEPDDLAVILYTSGSTGKPKGVMLSQQTLCNSGAVFAKYFGWTSNDVFMNLGDLHSMSGLRNTCITPLYAGASFIISQEKERNNILFVIELVQRYKINFIGVAPTVIRQLNMLFSTSRKELLAPLKAVLCTGCPLAINQLELFYNNYNKPVLNYYGLTETAGFSSGHNLDTFSPLDNSIGYPVDAEFIIRPGSEVGGETETGELLIKSGRLMSGYYKREKETEEVLESGCFLTGDIVRKRPDGAFELLGRKRNFVKNIYSELIYLEEIELALETHPLIKEAGTCRHARTEEEEKIIAFIVLYNFQQNPDSVIKDIMQYIYKNVGIHRAPWRYFVEHTLPRNSTGKIQREELEKKANEYLEAEHKKYI